MIIHNYRPLRDPGSGGGGGIAGTAPFDVATMAPEDVRGEPSLAAIKTVQDLAKGYVHAQKMIGAKRVAIPGDHATEAEMEQFYNAIGRPETADKYGVPEVQVDPSLKPDAAKLDAVKKHFHKLGLTTKQASGILEYYMKSSHEALTSSRSTSESQSAQAVQGLRTEWGTQFDANVDVAKSVIKKFGGEKLEEYLNGSGMGNNVELVRFLHKIGSVVMEDHDRGASSGGGLDLNDKTRAMHEIERLKVEPEFQKALNDARHPGHKGAAERWMQLFKVAHPGQEQT
jgi:hypothetical protein